MGVECMLSSLCLINFYKYGGAGVALLLVCVLVQLKELFILNGGTQPMGANKGMGYERELAVIQNSNLPK